MKERLKGSVEILCHEIEFPFSPGMETPRVIVAFVRQLVLEVAEMRWQSEAVKGVLRRDGPSIGSGKLLDAALDMLNGDDPQIMVERCAYLHAIADDFNPEDAYPADHLIDMLSSCISEIRFGCEAGCFGIGSRHAAEAAQQVWKHRYGVRLFDQLTNRWQKDWARDVLIRALTQMALPPTKGFDEQPLTQSDNNVVGEM